MVINMEMNVYIFLFACGLKVMQKGLISLTVSLVLYLYILCVTHVYNKALFQLCVSQECSQTPVLRTSTRGTITSPNYPNDYPNDADCWWAIQLPEQNPVSY